MLGSRMLGSRGTGSGRSQPSSEGGCCETSLAGALAERVTPLGGATPRTVLSRDATGDVVGASGGLFA